MIRRTQVPRRGYSLVDVIAVAGSIAVLTGMLAPAILHARAAARSNQCRSHLKQIGLALHNYHSTYLGFPPGWVSRFRDADSQPGFGWMTRLLPYLDQAPLYNQLNFSEPLPPPGKVMSMNLEVFQCPDEADATSPNAYRGGYGRSSYSGNMGDSGPMRWTDGRVESYWPGAAPTFHCAPRINFPRQRPVPGQPVPAAQGDSTDAMTYSINGIFGWNTRVGIRDVTDGTSNTLAVGERSQISGFGIWPGVGSNRFENDTLTDVSFGSVLNRSLTGFSSAHDGGGHFLMNDGAVRFLANDVESRPEGGVYQNLGNRADGEVIPPQTFGQ